MKVSKFGGTSLATAEQIRKVFDIVTTDPERRLIVVSAPGKVHKEDIKITDLLIACAEQFTKNGSAEKELNAVIGRYRKIAEGLELSNVIIEQITADFLERLQADKTNRESYLCGIKAGGEDNCAKLIAQFFQDNGFDARYINPKNAGLLVSAEHGNARVVQESYKNLSALKDLPGIMIFPGFFGYSPEGSIVTFPRGGSDITGAILSAAVKAEVYENFTDVDGVFAVNPHIVSNPQVIPELTYREMRELSYAGFSIIHDEALTPAFHADVPVCIKNTNNPSAPGTMIIPKRTAGKNPVVGIASDDGFCSIFVSKYLMNREIGFGRRLLQIFEEEGLSYEHTPSGIDNISVILRKDCFHKTIEKHVVQRIKTELEIDNVFTDRNLALIMIVGEGMQHTVGLAARVTGAFANASANIEMINQGSSEISMMFGVRTEDSIKAVKALYREFFEDE